MVSKKGQVSVFISGGVDSSTAGVLAQEKDAAEM